MNEDELDEPLDQHPKDHPTNLRFYIQQDIKKTEAL